MPDRNSRESHGQTLFLPNLAKTLLRLETPTSGRAIVYDRPVVGVGSISSRKEFLCTVQPIFQNPFEAFSRYRPVDSYLHETARRVANMGEKEAEDAVAQSSWKNSTTIP